jgi:hypothetical protein
MIASGGFSLAGQGRHLKSLTAEPERPLLRFESISFKEAAMGRGLLLWLIGVPIPVIILLWLFFGH